MVKTAIAYARQSVARDKDARDGGSVSTAFQLAAVEKWCQNNDVTLLVWHQDVDESGASSTRKGLDAFIAAVRQHRPDYAVMWDIKRLSRSLRLFLDVFDALQETRTELVSCTEGTRHPAFVWKMLVLFAEEERERIAVNITHGKREATKRGRHLGYPPLGYVRGEDGTLAIDEETAWIVRWLYARALEGHTATAICRQANERNLPTAGVLRRRRDPTAKLGATQWSRRTVEATLRRPTYAGIVQSGASSRSRYGRAVGIVTAEGTHPPLIDRTSWETVQRSLDGRSLPSRPRGSWHWLKTRVVCASCGGLVYFVDAGRAGKSYRDRYWRCSRSYKQAFGRSIAERCPSSVNRMADNALTDAVRDEFSGTLRREIDPQQVIRHLQKQTGARAITEREATERELADLQASRIAINDAIEQRIGVLADLAVRDRALIAKIDQANARLDTLPVPMPFAEIERSIATLNRIRAELASLADFTPEQWAQLAGLVDLRVSVDLERGRVCLSYREPYATMFGA